MDDLHNDLAAHVADDLTDDDLETQVDDEIADEMTREFFGEPADGGGQLAALSDARLAVIRAMIALTDVGDAQLRAITDLLAEVTRLREREAALLAERERLLAVVRAVVSLPPNGSLIEPIYITRETYMQACEDCWHTHDEQDEMEADDDDD